MYRLKHKPTGLYYVPCRTLHIQDANGYHYVKSNLSKKGKVYHQKPPINSIYYIDNHTRLVCEDNKYVGHVWKGTEEPFNRDDWEIEEIKI